MLNRVPGTFDLQQGFGIEPEFAIAEDGTLFSVSTASENFEDLFLFNRYAADGTLISEQAFLDPRDTQPGADRTIIDMIALEGGGFVTLFQYGVTTARTPVVRIHDANGEPASDYIIVPRVDETQARNNQDGYSLAPLPGGGFSVVVGSDLENQEQQTSSMPDFFRREDVRLIEFNADGSLVRSPILPHAIDGVTGVTENQLALSHDTFDDGRVLVAYTNSVFRTVPTVPPRTFEGHEIRVRIIEDGAVQADIQVFDPPFVPSRPFNPLPLPAPLPSSGVRDAPSAIVLSDGGFAVAYTLFTRDGADPLFVQFYTADGTPNGAAINTGIQEGSHEFAATKDGRLLILTDLPDVKLVLVDSAGVQDEELIENIIGVPRIDGVDVAPDGSIYVSSRNDVVHRFFLDDAAQIGTDANETLNGDAASNIIIGAGGDDTINGLGGDDQLEGGAGNDMLAGGGGTDTLLGGEGQDTAIFDAAFEAYEVSELADGFLRVERSGEVVEALSIEAFQFADVTLTREEAVAPPAPTGPTDAADQIEGTAGADTVQALGGDDTVNGQAGDDLILGGDGDDVLRGAAGDDRLRGNGGDDRLLGGGGNDNIKGNGGADVIRGNGGDDAIRAGGGADNVKGGGGSDLIFGGGGGDQLSGGGGADTLRGNGGDDVLRGNGGADVFQLRASDRNETILDFRQGQDMIQIQSGARTFEALDIQQDGRDVLIGFGAGQVRVVTDQMGAFSEDDFIF